jgi:S1-C subfamily serine protease
MALAWSVVVAAGLGALVGHQVWSSSSPTPDQSTGSSFPAAGGSTSNHGGTSTKVPAGSSAAEIANDVDPGLVDINTTLSYEQLQGAGTGMVLTQNGLVLTNNHVVEGATSISVTDIGNGRTYSASVVGYDRTNDVALIKLNNASGLTTVTLGSSVTNNEQVLAIGNAGGKGGTPSYVTGTVTGVDQSITASDEATGASEQLTGLIETDADIVPGDSGGPLVNSSGQVVGMDTAASQGYEIQSSGDQGYAIPITKAQSIASEINAGTATSSIHIGATAFLGVDVAEGDTSCQTSGFVIANVLPNTPAAAAGLEECDTITSLGGKSVDSPEGLTNVILAEKPGTTVQLEYDTPEGNQQSVSVQLQSGPPQ